MRQTDCAVNYQHQIPGSGPALVTLARRRRPGRSARSTGADSESPVYDPGGVPPERRRHGRSPDQLLARRSRSAVGVKVNSLRTAETAVRAWLAGLRLRRRAGLIVAAFVVVGAVGFAGTLVAVNLAARPTDRPSGVAAVPTPSWFPTPSTNPTVTLSPSPNLASLQPDFTPGPSSGPPTPLATRVKCTPTVASPPETPSPPVSAAPSGAPPTPSAPPSEAPSATPSAASTV
jgi:hypothetical protein